MSQGEESEERITLEESLHPRLMVVPPHWILQVYKTTDSFLLKLACTQFLSPVTESSGSARGFLPSSSVCPPCIHPPTLLPFMPVA